MGSGSAWLESFATHPVFQGSCAAGLDTSRRTSLLATRGTDLLAVVDNEIRITSLAQAKRDAADGAEADGYKVRRATHAGVGTCAA